MGIKSAQLKNTLHAAARHKEHSSVLDHIRKAGYFSIKEFGPRTDKTIFLFGGWGFGAASYKPLTSYLNKSGMHVILLVPNSDLVAVGVPFIETVRAGRQAVKLVKDTIKKDRDLGETSSYAAFGISLGTLFATECAKQCNDIRSLVLVAPSGDYAIHAPLVQADKFFNEVWSSQPGDMDHSVKVINRIATIHNPELLRGKDVLIFYSDKDEVMHVQAVEGLVELLKQNGAYVLSLMLKGRHFAGIVKATLLHKMVLTDFLRKMR